MGEIFATTFLIGLAALAAAVVGAGAFLRDSFLGTAQKVSWALCGAPWALAIVSGWGTTSEGNSSSLFQGCRWR